MSKIFFQYFLLKLRHFLEEEITISVAILKQYLLRVKKEGIYQNSPVFNTGGSVRMGAVGAFAPKVFERDYTAHSALYNNDIGS